MHRRPLSFLIVGTGVLDGPMSHRSQIAYFVYCQNKDNILKQYIYLLFKDRRGRRSLQILAYAFRFINGRMCYGVRYDLGRPQVAPTGFDIILLYRM